MIEMSSSAIEPPCFTIIGTSSEFEFPNEMKLVQDMESDDDNVKADALRTVIRMILNGEKFQSILMTVIRFVMPSRDHTVKKLLLLFWEVVPKYLPNGKLRQEMILVCDAYRQDLTHPNEYIRGTTLRFLCKLKEPELLEPLMPSILLCLEHKHSYVRRNAVLAIFTIYKNFDFLISDAPQKIYNFIEQEQDASCKRNAFIMLLHTNQEKALRYLSTCLDRITSFGDILQLVIVELIYKVCHSNPQERSRFIRCVYSLLQSTSPAVRYEAASTLITLSSAPTAIKAVASCYIGIILKESDNNIKLIVLGRLLNLVDSHERIVQDLIMDILHILSSSDIEVRQKTLQLATRLVSQHNVEEVINALRKELTKSCAVSSSTDVNVNQGTAADSANDVDDIDKTYRYHLVKTIRYICSQHCDMISHVVPTLCEMMTFEGNGGQSRASEEVCRFMRECLYSSADLKSMILENIVQYYPNVMGDDSLQDLLWLLGECSTTMEEIGNVMNLLQQVLGPFPLVDEEIRRVSGEGEEESKLLKDGPSISSSTRITADGTYATESAFTASATKQSVKVVKRPHLQATLFESKFSPAVVCSIVLVKLFCRYRRNLMLKVSNGELTNESSRKKENVFAAECMHIISCMIHLGRTKLVPHTVNPDHFDRMWIAIKVLADRNEFVLDIFDSHCSKRLAELMKVQQGQRNENISASQREFKRNVLHADEPIRFLQLCGSNTDEIDELEDRFNFTLSQALGANEKKENFSISKLRRVTQLTGFSDPIYAETYVTVNQYDVVLDVLIVNQTKDTLQNLNLELATLGDLKLVEKPMPLTMAPHDFANIKASIKVSSSENGVIFGNIVYDIRGSSGESNCVILNNINIDVMEYIRPSHCSTKEFRKMWSEFEWENKVTVNTKITDLQVFLSHVMRSTNMQCLTPRCAMSGDSDFLCTTLYAKSIFGEHILANFCLEKPSENQPITGHIRIRAKTQGMAVTIGEKISATQKQLPIIQNNKVFQSCAQSGTVGALDREGTLNEGTPA